MKVIPDLKRTTQDGVTLACMTVLMELLRAHVKDLAPDARAKIELAMGDRMKLWSAQLLSMALPNQVGLVKEIDESAQRVLAEMLKEAVADDASGGD